MITAPLLWQEPLMSDSQQLLAINPVLTIITMLYIKSLELVNVITGSMNLLTNTLHSPQLPAPLFYSPIV